MHLAELTEPGRIKGEAAGTGLPSALMAAAQRGNSRAFEALYHQHVGAVYGLCLRMVADRSEAEQLTQDAFVRAWQKIATYRGTGPFGAWLRRLTINVVIEHRRRQARNGRWLDVREDPDRDAGARRGEAPHSKPIPVEIAIDLEKAIAKLPPGARTVFVLHDVEGYRHREISAMTGAAVGTLKAQLHRARKLLRTALGNER